MARLVFPKGFVWGAATAAYQIEGATTADGRGESIWDRFSHTPGKTLDGATGDRACDHYHRVTEDVGLMRELGLGAYRFSVAWPRILPTGSGAVEPRGVDFYSRLVDRLLAAGITPFLTLYHWDLPQALQDRGGWAAREIADRFADYATVVGRALGDRVKHWITLNEPQVFTTLGHLIGQHAPGLADPPAFFRACHHVNLAHGRAVQALRAAVPGARIGTSLQLPAIHPVSDTGEDVAAARRFDGLFNRWYLDPLLRGSYPEDALALLGPLGVPIQDGDLAVASSPIDFIGLNHYTRIFVRHDPSIPLFALRPLEDHPVPGARYTAMGWEVYPDGLYEVLTRLRTEYGNPTVYVTENGCAQPDVVEAGRVHDPARIAYLTEYLGAAHRALAEGSQLAGYFVWSLLDNFEWSFGYSKRFGLVHVDEPTGVRTPKDSARFYAQVIQGGAVDV